MLTDPLTLPISPLWEYLILLILGVIAFKIGWYISPGGALGSVTHWIVRFFALIALWAITYWTIVAVQWILINRLLVVAFLLALTAVISAILIVRLKVRR